MSLEGAHKKRDTGTQLDPGFDLPLEPVLTGWKAGEAVLPTGAVPKICFRRVDLAVTHIAGVQTALWLPLLLDGASGWNVSPIVHLTR